MPRFRPAASGGEFKSARRHHSCPITNCADHNAGQSGYNARNRTQTIGGRCGLGLDQAAMKTQTLLLGQTLLFTGNPLSDPWEDTVRIASDGAVFDLRAAHIKRGPRRDLRKAHPQATVKDYGDR